MASAVREHAHGIARSRDARAARLARGQARARARPDVSLGANHGRARTDADVPDDACRERREVPGERSKSRTSSPAASGEWRRGHGLSAALLLGRPRRQPGAALARAPLWRRDALRLRRGTGRNGTAPVRLAAQSARIPGAELAV